MHAYPSVPAVCWCAVAWRCPRVLVPELSARLNSPHPPRHPRQAAAMPELNAMSRAELIAQLSVGRSPVDHRAELKGRLDDGSTLQRDDWPEGGRQPLMSAPSFGPMDA